MATSLCQPIMTKVNGTSSNSAGRPRKRERPPNKGAHLLSSTENAVLFSLLGRDSVSLAAGVVQLLRTDSRNPRAWMKAHIGVISLVKDFEKRAYFLRLYDISKKQFLWQQMLYKNFRATATNCPNLLTFEGDDCVFGLNFSNLDEADNFKYHLNKRYEQEQKSRVTAERAANSGASHGTSMKTGVMSSITSPTLSTTNKVGITSIGAVPSVGGQLANLVSSSKKKKKNNKERKIRKEDISNPTNFQHKAHVGWDQDGGFSQKTYDGDPMDDSVRDLLRAAGENPDMMTKEDIDFSRKFITGYQKLPQPFIPQATPISQRYPLASSPSVSATNTAPPPPPPPPPPIRRDTTTTSSRPFQRPPQSVTRAPVRPLPQLPSLSSVANNQIYRPNDIPPPPPPPPPVTSQIEVTSYIPPATPSGPPPPPPPPPPPSCITQQSYIPPPPPPPPPAINEQPSLAVTSDRANLLNEIQAGITLKHVDKNLRHRDDSANPHENVMAEIKQGANLRHVDQTVQDQRKLITSAPDGIAGALARALEERRKNIQQSDESDEDEPNSGSEWETE